MPRPRSQPRRAVDFFGRLAAAFASTVLLVAGPPTEGREDEGIAGPPLLLAFRQPEPDSSGPQLSDAEQISRLRRAIVSTEARLAELQAVPDDPMGEFILAESAFAELDASHDQLKKDVREADPEDLAALQFQLDALEKPRALAKERFDLAIEERKALREQAVNLEVKLRQDREALERLIHSPAGAAPPDEALDPGNDAAPAPIPAATSTPRSTGPPAANLAPPTPAAAVTDTSAGLPSPEAPEVSATSPDSQATADRPDSKELIEAREAVREKESRATEAETQARSIAERLEAIERNIELEHSLIATARKKADNAEQTRQVLAEQFEARSVAGAPEAELRALADQVRKARTRVGEVRGASQGHSDRLSELQTEHAALLAEQLEAARQADAARREVELAERKVNKLENPFAPLNLLRWAIDHGPRLLAIVCSLVLLHWIARSFSRRVVRLMARSGIRGSREEREARANTLVGVFHNAASVALFVGGALMILQEVGIPIAPLLGGAAIFGLAVAFGTQNLIRDYFYGFVILLENQYRLNDVIRISGLSGQVEKITLRMTVLRDLEGCVHFIPNGQITSVTNMTHGWSRAQFDVPVAYKENVDRVIAILLELGSELRNDPAFKLMILEDLEMLGVDEFADSGVVIRFLIKTRTLKQWAIKREMLRRIKIRFDAEGIEIPFPHRTVYHRLEGVALDQDRGLPGYHLGSRDARSARDRG